MNTKTKVRSIRTLFLVLAAAVLSVTLIAMPANTQAAQTDSNFTLSYAQGEITVNMPSAYEGDSLQIWAKKYIPTDQSTDQDALGKTQAAWSLEKTFAAPGTSFEVEDYNDYLIDGFYNIIVRVKTTGGSTAELFGQFSPESANQLTINSVAVGELGQTDKPVYAAYKQDGSLALKVNTVITADSYWAEIDGDDVVPAQANSLLSLDISGLPVGEQVITVFAQKDTEVVSQKVKVYVYNDYSANIMPVINGLSQDLLGGGKVDYIMDIGYADGGLISEQAIQTGAVNIRLFVNGTETFGMEKVSNGEGFVTAVKFSKDYLTSTGIYQVTGQISREGISGTDDKVIRYFDGYTADTTLNKVSGNTSAVIDQDEKYAHFSIEYAGTVTGSQNVYYAYYREDASGWTMIRDYTTSGKIEWRPTRIGDYNIQVRIKGDNSGSYEAIHSQVYTVQGSGLQGELEIGITDIADDIDISNNPQLLAGKPYMLTASLQGYSADDLLYMYILTTDNLGTVYLSKYSASPNLIYVPNKLDDNMRITLRVISKDGYGFKELSTPLSVQAVQVGAEDLGDRGEFELYGNSEITVALPSIDTSKVLSVMDITNPQNPVQIDFSGTGSNLVLATQNLSYGQRTLQVSTYLTKYNVNLLAITKVLSTASDIQQITTLGGGRDAAERYYGYFVLGNDIDLGTAVTNAPVDSAGTRVSTKGFVGVLDGCGYTLYNGSYNSTGGLFGTVSAEGVVKNLTIVDVLFTGHTDGSGVIAQKFYGTLENVFIGGTHAGTLGSSAAISYIVSGATIKNCVVDVNYTNTNANNAALVFWLADSPSTFTDVYITSNYLKDGAVKVFGAGSTDMTRIRAYQPTDVDKDFSLLSSDWDISGTTPILKSTLGIRQQKLETNTQSMDGMVFFDGVSGSLSAGAGFADAVFSTEGSDYFTITSSGNWSVSGMSEGQTDTATLKISTSHPAIFVEYTINLAVKQTLAVSGFTDFDLSQTEEYTLQLPGDVVGEQLVSVAIEGTPITGASLSGTTLTLPNQLRAALVYGEHALIAQTDTYIITANILAITKVLKTVEDIQQITALGGGRDATERYYGYFVLGNDIDLGNAAISAPIDTSGRIRTRGFVGVFDGRGYTISGGVYSIGGLFGSVSSTGIVKNLALTNVTFHSLSPNGSGVMAQNFYGTLENVFIGGNHTGTNGAQGVISYVAPGAILKNCVIDVRITNNNGSNGTLIGWLSDAATYPVTFTNVYVISDLLKDGQVKLFGNGTAPSTAILVAYKPTDTDKEFSLLADSDWWEYDEDNNQLLFNGKVVISSVNPV